MWFVLGLGIPELIALFTSRNTHTDNTLSNYSWIELHVSSTITVHTVAWWVSLTVTLVSLVILILHIWWHQFS